MIYYSLVTGFIPTPRLSELGGECLKTIDISLTSKEHVRSLVNITNRYPFTIALRQGRYVVDGKSILGVCSLHHLKPVTMEIYSDNCEALIDDLQELIC